MPSKVREFPAFHDLRIDGIPGECESHSNKSHYVFSKEDIKSVFNKSFYLEIISSDAFRRLKDIEFLGAIDYVITPISNFSIKRHSRYQHSLNVGRLALQYSKAKELNPSDEKLIVAAALLHDIGHAPLSHSLESVFKEFFGITHHHAGRMIIKGSGKVGRKLPSHLRFHGVDPDDIINLMEGKLDLPFTEIFKNPINIDTIDGILRSFTYISPCFSILPPSAVLSSYIQRKEDSLRILDAFWEMKQVVYRYFIRGPIGLLADHTAQEHMRNNIDSYSQNDFFLNSKSFKKRHGSLFQELNELRKKKLLNTPNSNINYQDRVFKIDNDIDISSNNAIENRYKQEKLDRVY